MAANQQAVVLDILKQAGSSVVKLLDAFDELEALQEQLAGADITLSDWDSVIENNGDVQHATGDTWRIAITQVAPAIVTSMKSTLYSGTAQWDWLQKVRK